MYCIYIGALLAIWHCRQYDLHEIATSISKLMWVSECPRPNFELCWSGFRVGAQLLYHVAFAGRKEVDRNTSMWRRCEWPCAAVKKHGRFLDHEKKSPPSCLDLDGVWYGLYYLEEEEKRWQKQMRPLCNDYDLGHFFLKEKKVVDTIWLGLFLFWWTNWSSRWAQHEGTFGRLPQLSLHASMPYTLIGKKNFTVIPLF